MTTTISEYRIFTQQIQRYRKAIGRQPFDIIGTVLDLNTTSFHILDMQAKAYAHTGIGNARSGIVDANRIDDMILCDFISPVICTTAKYGLISATPMAVRNFAGRTQKTIHTILEYKQMLSFSKIPKAARILKAAITRYAVSAYSVNII